MIYLVNRDGEVVSSTDSPVDPALLAAAGLAAVASKLDLPLHRTAALTTAGRLEIVERQVGEVETARRLRLTPAPSEGAEVVELPADGKSSLAVVAELVDAAGKPVTDTVEVTFRTNRGTLSARRVQARKGRAEVRLTSTLETVAGALTASAPGCQPAQLAFEFIPPSEVFAGKAAESPPIAPPATAPDSPQAAAKTPPKAAGSRAAKRSGR